MNKIRSDFSLFKVNFTLPNQLSFLPPYIILIFNGIGDVFGLLHTIKLDSGVLLFVIKDIDNSILFEN